MNYNICTYYVYLHYNCSFLNLNNFGILSKLKSEMLRTYPHNGINVEVNALDGYAFQITNSLTQQGTNESDFSNIDLGDCEIQLKQAYGIDPSISLIFFKFENIGSSSSDKDIQYEIYNPITYEKLNLSICTNPKIKISIPIEIDEKIAELIQNILDQGYNPFDLNDKFYREICTPYNSENGTDVLLDDREEYIYSTIANETSCPEGCTISSFALNSKYITCECGANDGIVELDYHHISGKNILSSVLSTLKNSNYKVMRCYNLVFNFKIFCHNFGSILTLIFFVIYVIFMIYYCCKDITPIKVSISKLLFDEQKKDIKINDTFKPYTVLAKSEKTKKSTSSKKKKQAKSTKDFNPPKKSRPKKTFNTSKKNNLNSSFEKKKRAGDIKLIDLTKRKRHSIKNKPQKDDESVKSDKVRKRKSIVDYEAEVAIKTNDNFIKEKKNFVKKLGSKINIYDSNKKLDSEENLKDPKDKNKEESFDNFELNNMDYYDASDNDKRSCIRTYFSVLLREHYVLFTFCSRNDYNLFYVKIERFFILICTEMTMNGMFFVHETMYKKRTGGLTLGQKIPQFVFSLLVSHAIEVLLCFLGMTDVHYYEIKGLPKKEKNDERIFKILDKMKRKLIGFFVFTFLLFLFHWYFISAFCAVYQNTQIIFLRDSGISILTSLIDPFIIYSFTCILRAISLSKCCKKKLSCVYKLSDLIPIF